MIGNFENEGAVNDTGTTPDVPPEADPIVGALGTPFADAALVPFPLNGMGLLYHYYFYPRDSFFIPCVVFAVSWIRNRGFPLASFFI